MDPTTSFYAARPTIRSTNGAVSAGHYLAASAGMRVLARGGNAIDAGVAAGLCLNVVHNDMCCLSGVAPIILYRADLQRVFSIAGVGTWGEKVDRDLLREKYATTPMQWPDNTVVPAALDSWITVLRDHGTLSFAEVCQPALEYAEDGYPMGEFQHRCIAKYLETYQEWEENRRIFLRDGEVPAPGERIVQTDLARTLGRFCRVEAQRTSQGRKAALTAIRDHFYKGPVGKELAAYGQEVGSVLSESDFARYEVRYEPPLAVSFRGLDVYGCGPWSQGPVLLQVLRLLDTFDPTTFRSLNPDAVHLAIESLKAAFWDRAAYYGDPQFVDVPMQQLLGRAYAERRASAFDVDAAHEAYPSPSIDDVMRVPADEMADTSYVAVMDRHGNIFSATPSDGYSSGGICPGLGLHLSERGAQGGLDQDDPNRIEPFKRPRLTPNPSLVLRNGEAYMALGTPGNDRQPQAMLQVLLNLVAYGATPQEAVEAPRFASYGFPASTHPHHVFPNRVYVEEDYPAAISESLTERGHDVQQWPARDWQAGGVCVIRRSDSQGVVESGADPRRDGYAIGI
jgi:gamma-glutamyltranspeptidase/glutathione hydrolase